MIVDTAVMLALETDERLASDEVVVVVVMPSAAGPIAGYRLGAVVARILDELRATAPSQAHFEDMVFAVLGRSGFEVRVGPSGDAN